MPKKLKYYKCIFVIIFCIVLTNLLSEAECTRRAKLERLGGVLKSHVDRLRAHSPKTDLVFCVDSSASVGPQNFYNEIKFIKKVLADFTVSENTTRVAIITYSSVDSVIRQVDHISKPSKENHKCQLFQKNIPDITYNSGGTFTLGALREALDVFRRGRRNADRALFLITDGYSNGGDPRPVAKLLKAIDVEIFTFGIRNGNIRELRDISSYPKNEHSFILESFREFESLARRALHKDVSSGHYIPQNESSCVDLCYSGKCCDARATCACGTHTGHYACLCPKGFYGRGVTGDCIPCPPGTYKPSNDPGDVQTCLKCPLSNQISSPGSSDPYVDCRCKEGFELKHGRCRRTACPKLEPPENGVFFGRACQNSMNEACAVKCRSGYVLVRGSPLRVCLPNGTWSGQQPSCEPKKCRPLMKPRNGFVKCSSRDFSVDSECRISCAKGYRLVGSHRRICLPISLWSGLPSYCKPLKCHRLRRPNFGQIYPTACQKHKQLFGRKCAFACHSGFRLVGPSLRTCVSPGMWDGGPKRTRCIDISPPKIQCPKNLVVDALPGKHYAVIANFSSPLVEDNSGYEPNIRMYPAVTPNMKLKIGVNKIKYTAVDLSRNKNKCFTTITVRDTEPPVVDVCSSPPVFLTQNEWELIEWDEPIFHDNSLKELRITKTHAFGRFDIGTTMVHYEATDPYGNKATCDVKITLQKHFCSIPDDPINGHQNCTDKPNGVYCTMSCSDGYAIAMSSVQSYKCEYREGVWKPESEPFPDCSIVSHASSVVSTGILTLEMTTLEYDDDDEESLCDHPLMNKLTDVIRIQMVESLAEICDESLLYCDLGEFELLCERILEEYMIETNSIYRRRRRKREEAEKSGIRKKKKDKKRSISVILKFLLKGTSPDKIANPLILKKFFDSQSRILKTSFLNSPSFTVEDKVFVVKNLNISRQPTFVCAPGSIKLEGSKNLCVNCPVGSFFNESKSDCQYCERGFYQDQEASLKCIQCPQGTTTKKLKGSKSSGSCQRQCSPGTYSSDGFEPCSTCLVGFYQSLKGERKCLKCPNNFTTSIRGSEDVSKCLEECEKGYISETGLSPCYPCPSAYYQDEPGKNLCKTCKNVSADFTNKTEILSQCKELEEYSTVEDLPEVLYMNDCFSSPCSPKSICRPLTFGFQCVCLPGYTGPFCDVKMDGCLSNPCDNGGICVREEDGYHCQCPRGFKGTNCQLDVDECVEDPLEICANGGNCTNEFGDYRCTCPEGFSGKHCLVNTNTCFDQGCFNGGTCQNSTLSCICPAGYSGQFCEEEEEEDECSPSPCLNGGSCINGDESEDGFLCLCTPLYEGHLCETKTKDCRSRHCLNGGECALKESQSIREEFLCICPHDFSGDRCQIKLSPDFVLNFDSSIQSVPLNGEFPPLKKFTFCFWMRTTDSENFGTPFSYSVSDQDNELTLTDYNGFVLYIKGSKVVTDITANDGHWTFLCGTWSSSPKGTWKLYKNGEESDSGDDLAVNQTIRGNGVFLLGQEQDSVGGNFSDAESFRGGITSLYIWADDILTLKDIQKIYTSNKVSNPEPTLYWNQFRRGIRGTVNITSLSRRRACPPLSQKEGLIISLSRTDKSAKFSCQQGYKLTKLITIFCGYFGEWSNDPPSCIHMDVSGNLVLDTLPGYMKKSICTNTSDNCTQKCYFDMESQFHNGSIHFMGSPLKNTKIMFDYGDDLSFYCDDEFRIDGNRLIECGNDGVWSDEFPICQYKKCSKVPKILHGRPIMDNASKPFPEGSKLFYSCDKNYEFAGENYISCLNNGTWSETLPKCVEIECSIPHDAPNAKLRGFSEKYPINSTVYYDCIEGFDTPSELIAISCLSSGTWSVSRESLEGCMPVDCGDPSPPMIQFAYVEYISTTFGQIAKYYCEKGFAFKHLGLLNDPFVEFVCGKDGVWLPADPTRTDYKCVTNYCIQPTKPDYLNSQYTNLNDESRVFELGESIIYSCKRGYRKLSGDSRRSCLLNGVWSGELLKCGLKTCTLSKRLHRYFLPPVWDEYEVGSSVKVKCPEGFIPFKEEIVCLEEEKWSKSPKDLSNLCFPVTCSSVKNVQNGILDVLGFNYGSQINVDCAEGYKLRDKERHFFCGSSGTWIGNPECVPVLCSVPESAPTDGIIQPELSPGSLIEYGQALEYSCNEGYYMKGPKERICGKDGSWSGEETSCIPNDQICPTPDIIENGLVSFSTGTIKEGHLAMYRCKNQLIGENRRVCLPSGDWSGSKPRCIEDCVSIDSIENGEVIQSPESTIVQFQCDPGHYLVNGDETIDCRKKIDSIPRCIPLECPWPPPAVEHSYVKGDSYNFGDSIVYKCEDNYTLIGNDVVFCDSRGEWGSFLDDESQEGGPISISCVKIFCEDPPHSISNGWVRQSTQIPTPGKTIEIKCKYGYRLIGFDLFQAECLPNGQWSQSFENIQCIPITCQFPEHLAPFHGSVVYPGMQKRSVFHVLEQIHFKCNRGYVISSGYPTSSRCTSSGHWNNARRLPPICEPIRCSEAAIRQSGFRNGAAFGDNRVHGELRFRCNIGYFLIGYSHLRCLSTGEWNQNPPLCIPFPPCPPIETPSEVLIKFSHYRNTYSASFSCASEQYSLKNASFTEKNALICDRRRKKWKMGGKDINNLDNYISECSLTRCNLKEYPFVSNMAVVNTKPDTNLGSITKLICSPGFDYSSVKKTAEIQCSKEDGTWSYPETPCRPKICPFDFKTFEIKRGYWRFNPGIHKDYQHQKSNFVVFGDSIVVKCNKGYDLDGTPEIRCTKSGRLIPNFPLCKPVHCNGSPKKILNGRAIIRGRFLGANLTYQCHPNYQLINISKTIHCLSNKTWSGEPPKCVPLSCSKPEEVLHATMEYYDTKLGSRVEYHCKSCYAAFGEKVGKCRRNGKWSNEGKIKCREITCPNPPKIHRGKREIISKMLGGTINYVCNKNYRLKWDSTLTCLKNGSWSVGYPSCSFIHNCPPLSPAKNSNTESINVISERIVEYVCKPDFELEGPHRYRICKKENWSLPIPKCRTTLNCRNVPKIENGITIPKDYSSVLSDVLEVSCQNGFVLKENSSVFLMCNSNLEYEPLGKSLWPICEPLKCIPIQENETSTSIGDIFYPKCSLGTKMQKPGRKTCNLSGEWIGLEPVCSPITCRPPPKIANGYSFVLHAHNINAFTVGTKAIYGCDEGFRILKNTSNEIICNPTGHWDMGDLPVCFPEHPCKSGNFISGTRFTSVSNCSSDLRIFNDGFETGILTSDARKNCSAKFCTAPVLNNGLAILHRGYIYFVCNLGYTLEGSAKIKCEEIKSYPMCVPNQCHPPSAIKNGFVKGSDYTYNKTIRYFCNDGYKLVGIGVRKCLPNALWDRENPPFCKKKTCPKFHIMDPNLDFRLENNLKINNKNITIKFTCLFNYKLVGEEKARCLSSGEWDITSFPRCVANSCGRPRQYTGATLLSTSFMFGSLVPYACPSSKIPIFSPIFCDGDGIWSNDAFCATIPYKSYHKRSLRQS